MEQIKHFTHHHPLILCDELHSDNAVQCYLCGKPMTVDEGCSSSSSSSSYRCASFDKEGRYCQNFILHKTCAEAPEQIEQPIHHHHPLLKMDQLLFFEPRRICHVCDLDIKRAYYICADENCLFRMCLTCSFQKERNIEHPGHNYKDHALILVQRRALFRCDACGEKHEDSSYICNACPFWMHLTCASVQTSIDCKFHHDHPLTLAYFLPQRYRYRISNQLCAICNKELNPIYWLYYCVDCRFFAHIKCATSTDTPLRSSENDEADHDNRNLLHAPVTNESSIDLMIQQFGKANSLTDDGDMRVVADWAREDHPLVLLDQLQRNKINTTESQMLCSGCVRPILSDPFYGCAHAQCNFFLHTFCAQLPLVAKHPLHEEHELVIHKSVEPNIYVYCYFCKRICNGMFYYCKDCEFYLDIKCASLPSTIKYATHRHPLRQIYYHERTNCRGCGKYVSFRNQNCFGCIDCEFYVHESCIFLPGTINHRWDPHPIPLVHAPIKDHPDEFYCEICEEEIDGTSHSFYFCRACDQSFHIKCLYPYYGYSYMKLGATNITFKKHPHSLTFVAMQQNKFPYSKCWWCGGHIRAGSPMLECQPCHFRLCMDCYSDSGSSFW